MKLAKGKKAACVAALVALACGCSAGAAGSSNVLTKPSGQIADPNTFMLRWFPVKDAMRYRLYVESPDGKQIKQADITPTGCTHPKVEGYLSGVCTLAYSLPDAEKPFVVRLTTINAGGKESKAASETVK